MKKRKFIRKLLILTIIIVTILIFNFICNNQSNSEFLSRHISRHYIAFIGRIINIIPISFYEVLILSLIIIIPGLIIYIICLAKSKKLKKLVGTFMNLLVFVALNILSAVIAIAPGYNRNYLEFPEVSEISKEQYLEAINYFTADFNQLAQKLTRNEEGIVESPYSFKELNSLINSEFTRVINELDDQNYLSSTKLSSKKVQTSIMNYLGISGIFFANISEANVSITNYANSMPHIIAHELAHLRGVMREYEANMIASYLLLSSDNEYLRYCGYLEDYGYYLLRGLKVYDNDLYLKYYQELNTGIKLEYEARSKTYNQYNNIFAKFGEYINDLYLKFNGQGGTASYYDPGEEEVEIIEDEDGEEVEVVTYYFSQTERALISIYLLK